MSGFGSGLFWGAVFGGLAGLLNAPRKGKETRERLKHQIEVTTEDINDLRYKIDNLSVATQRLATEGLDAVNDASYEIQTSVRQFTEEASPRVKRINRHLTKLQEDIEKVQADSQSDATKSEE